MTADKVAARIDATQKQVRGRRIPPPLAAIEELKKTKVCVFNVGPWPQIVPCGSIGTYVIPANVDKKGRWLNSGYTEMTPRLSLIEDELVIASETDYARLQDDGRRIAVEILGEGRGQNPAHSRRHFGIGIAEGEKPTKAELEEARGYLNVRCSEIIADMRRMWDVDKATAHKILQASGRTVQMVAAEVLGLGNEAWMTQSTPSENLKCPMCRVSVEPDAPICHNCKSVINEQAYLAIKARQKELDEVVVVKSKLFPQGKGASS
jgi:hypothetical protein